MAIPITTNQSAATSQSPVQGLSWAEFGVLKRYLPAYNPSNNAERLKWITYLNKTRNTDDGGRFSTAPSSINVTQAQQAYDKISKLAEASGATDSYVARSIRKLQYNNSLQAITAKTAIGIDGFFSETSDRIGTTLTGVLNAVDDVAGFALDQLEEASAKIKKSTAEYKSRRALSDANNNPESALKGNSATKNILSRAGDAFNGGWSTLNSKMKQNRLANVPGDMFNSARTLLYTIRQELEQLLDAVHQIFHNIQAAIIKLIRKIKAIVKAIVTILMSALDWLLEVSGIQSYIESILSSVGDFLNDVGENLKDTVNTLLGASEGESVMVNIFADLNKEIGDITSTGVFTYMWKALSTGSEIGVAIPGLDKITDIQRKIETPLVNSLSVLKSYSDINWLLQQLPESARRTLGIIQALSTNAKGFIGNGIRSVFVKNVLKGKNSLFLGSAKNKAGLTFTFAQPYHFGSSQYQYNPYSNPIFVLPRLAVDNTSMQVDRSGNKFNYNAYTNTNLF